MSIQAMSSCWGPEFPADAEGISPAMTRVVALAIADVVNDLHGNEFYGSRKLLSRKVGCDPDTVSDVIRHLVERGVMVEIKRDPGRPVVYRWALGAPEKLSTGKGGSGESPQGGCGDSPPGVRSTTARGAVTSPLHKTNRYARETRGSGSSEDSGRRDYDIEAEEAAVIANRFGVNIDPDGEAPEWVRAYGPHLDNGDTLTS